VLGFAPDRDFVGYLAACDIVLNLRHPTVGESSGTLLRALGLGKAALVSEVGSFRELPDDVCLKVPVGPGEEDAIFEYMNLLASRPDVAREIGARAKDYVARECGWGSVARRYAEFLEDVAKQGPGAGGRGPGKSGGVALGPLSDVRGSEVRGSEVRGSEARVSPAAGDPVEEGRPTHEGCGYPGPPHPDPIPYLRTWADSEEAGRYVEAHQTRLAKTLDMIPPGEASDRILEMGAYLQITPALRSRMGYGEVRGCYNGKLGQTDHCVKTSSEGERFACDVDHFDAEKDVFPYAD
jgi:hypothetical protein